MYAYERKREKRNESTKTSIEKRDMFTVLNGCENGDQRRARSRRENKREDWDRASESLMSIELGSAEKLRNEIHFLIQKQTL